MLFGGYSARGGGEWDCGEWSITFAYFFEAGPILSFTAIFISI